MSVVPLRPPSPEEADLNSRTYAVRTVSEVLRSGEHGVDTLPGALLRAIRLEAWKEFETPMGNIYRNKNMAEWIVAAPPQGLGSSVAKVRQLLMATERAEEALLAFDAAVYQPPGGANNPGGSNQYRKPDEVNLDNIQVDQKEPTYPTGTSAQAGIRRLRKAAESDQRAADLLAQVVDSTSDMSIHRACKEMGWRKDISPIKAVQTAWRKASQEEREQIAAWIDEQMSPLRRSAFR